MYMDKLFEAVACTAASSGMALMLAILAHGVWRGWRLMRVLRERYPATWAEITTLWGMPGMNNPFRSLPWFLGPDYCGDEEVRKLKKASLWSSILCLVAITVIPGMVMAVFVILAILKGIIEGS